MNNSQAMEATIFASLHPDIVRRVHILSLIGAIVLVSAGLGIFFSAFQLNDKTSNLSMLLIVLGTAAFLLGIFRLLWKSRQLVYLPTGGRVTEASLYFDFQNMDKLKDLLEKGSFPLDTYIKSTGSGNLRLDILYSQDSKFAAVQLFQFIPYAYTPVTKVHYFTGDKASALITYLYQHKK